MSRQSCRRKVDYERIERNGGKMRQKERLGLGIVCWHCVHMHVQMRTYAYKCVYMGSFTIRYWVPIR
jgi:hypothetical protein